MHANMSGAALSRAGLESANVPGADLAELELNRNRNGDVEFLDDGHQAFHLHPVYRWREVDHNGFRSSFYIGTRF